MASLFKKLTTSDSLKARTLRGMLASVWLAGGSQMLRFASNLVLTRLLFPEAFGLMVLVQVILTGLTMLSTIGLRASVVQSPNGDEPAFLNTIWTFQIIRGFILWIVVCLFANRISIFFDQPQLAQILPVAGISLAIQGFYTTNVLSVQRHMELWRHTYLTLTAQVIHLIILAILAYLLESVWALVIGLLILPILSLGLYARYLPGIRNRLQWDGSSARNIMKLGKFLMFSTIATYVLSQSDRIVLGLLIPVDLLGIYGIAMSLAMIPQILSAKIADSVVFPLYRLRHPSESLTNRRNIFRLRRLVGLGSIGLLATAGLVGPWVIAVLYDDRYILAGPIIVLLSIALVPQTILKGVMNAALSKGDSFRFMVVNVATALTQAGLLYVLALRWDILGTALAIGLAPLLTYPLVAVFLRKYNSWDWLGDTLQLLVACFVMALILRIHWDIILVLAETH